MKLLPLVLALAAAGGAIAVAATSHTNTLRTAEIASR